MIPMKYKKGYKYQLVKPLETMTPIKGRVIDDDYIHLNIMGILTLRKGYASDGASFIAIDTKTIMRAAFIHDSLYESIRKGYLPAWYRKDADKIFKAICKADGMS